MKQRTFNIFILAIIGCLGILQCLDFINNKSKSREYLIVLETKDVEPTFFVKSPKEGLMEALIYYNVKHPEIVYAQAVLETGHFTSTICQNRNNLFGLYNSNKKEFYSFDHWSESVIAYIDFIQYKYKPPSDYYEFLDTLGYAEDPDYINKLRIIVSQYDKRRTSDSSSITY